MKPSLGAKSIALFLISIALLVLLTLFESSLAGLPSTTQRFIGALCLVLPALAGVTLGVLSLARKEPKPWVACLGILFNILFGLFHLFVLSFAG